MSLGFVLAFAGSVALGWLLFRLGGVLVAMALALVTAGVVAAVIGGGPAVREGAQTGTRGAPARATWADAGRALSGYGARHREVHAVLRQRAAAEAGGAPGRGAPP